MAELFDINARDIDYEKEYESDEILFDKYWRNGRTIEDRNAIVLKYYRMAVMAASTSCNPSAVMDSDDVAQCAVLHLIKAVENYRKGSTTTFGTYLFKVVHNNIKADVAGTSQMSIPFSMYTEIVKIKGAMERNGITRTACSADNIKTISADTNIKEKRIKKLIASPQFDAPISISVPSYTDESGATVTIEDSMHSKDVADSVIDDVYREDFMECVSAIISQIEESGSESDKRNIRIVKMRCGFETGEPMSFGEIAEKVGVSERAASVYHSRTIAMFREKLYDKFETA